MQLFIQAVLPFILFSHTLQAQTVLEVATKTLEKKILFNAQGTIFLNGENATVKISTWNKNEVQIHLKLMAKHPEKAVVTKQLDNIKYIIEKKGANLFLRNYYLTDDNPPIACIMKAEYELIVPIKSNIVIKNSLGNISLENLEGSIDVETKFGDVDLHNIKGKIQVNLSLGNLTANQIEAFVNVNANSSKVKMENLKGKYYFTATNSDLIFRPNHVLRLLDINTKNGDVKLWVSPADIYNYALHASYGEIRLPDEWKGSITKEKNKSFFKYQVKAVKPTVVINSDFGKIILINNLIEHEKQN